jgi:TetR/AcrR family transcriptional regulator, lmrAB and yxaGH operons repressor
MSSVIVKWENELARDSKARMVRSAAALIGTRGLSATSFSDVLTHSGAPRGSIYHHFPDGKRQLAVDAIDWTSDQVLGHLRACRATTPSALLACFIDLWRQSVVASRGSTGCAVAGVAIDIGAFEDDLIGKVRGTFRSWVDGLAARLMELKVPSDRARSIAVAAVAGMEGALILCRAEGSSQPLEAVASELMRLAPARARASRLNARKPRNN